MAQAETSRDETRAGGVRSAIEEAHWLADHMSLLAAFVAVVSAGDARAGRSLGVPREVRVMGASAGAGELTRAH
ncbi:MAG: hypothetical protein IT208_10095 [Chthonomonadales bacterium]|nr:hypothetical protein [Chthonomonadales bacterium]